MSNAKEILESLNKFNEKESFVENQFVYDTVYKGYGLIKELHGDEAIVDLYRTQYGALCNVSNRKVLLAYLRDGETYINKEISKLERKIQTQKDIKLEITGMIQKGM